MVKRNIGQTPVTHHECVIRIRINIQNKHFVYLRQEILPWKVSKWYSVVQKRRGREVHDFTFSAIEIFLFEMNSNIELWN